MSEVKARPRKYMIVSLGESRFAVPLSEVREVIGLPRMTKLPNMPSFFAGILNLRGKVISVVDLKLSLSGVEIRDTKSLRPCVVITEASERLFGAIVSDVIEVIGVIDEQIEKMVHQQGTSQAMEGIIKIGNKPMAPILNLKEALRVPELIQE